MEKRDKLYSFAKKQVSGFFQNGKGLRSVKLKNYTSGDGANMGFEKLTESILKKAIQLHGLKDRAEINGEYLKHGTHDNQRLDNHVWIDGKLALLEENRAWIDKPFYTLKRAVVRTFMQLPHIKEKMADNIKFIFSCLAKDVTKKTEYTMNEIMGHGEVIEVVNFSGLPRRAKKRNYFDEGYSSTELRKYTDLLCDIFEEYEKS